jgi:1,4-dihydroxy-2-naphthoate octaprenyltransferase
MNYRNKAIRFIKVLLFTASIIPALILGAMAKYHNNFNTTDFILLAIGLFLGQAGGDYFYYYFTNYHTDARDSHTKIFAGWKPFFTGSLIKNGHGVIIAAILCLLIDLLIAIFFTIKLGYIVLIFGFGGALLAVSFTQFMLRGYKEIFIFITFGPVIFVCGNYALSQTFTIESLLVSLPIGLLTTVVAYLKGAKYEVKEENGNQKIINLKSNPIILLFGAAYFSLIIFALTGLLPIWTLTGLISLPLTFIVIKKINQKSSGMEEYLWAVVMAILAMVITGLSMSISFLIL